MSSFYESPSFSNVENGLPPLLKPVEFNNRLDVRVSWSQMTRMSTVELETDPDKASQEKK